MTLYPKPQELQSINAKDYKVKIIVFGTRHYNNRKQFHETILDYLENFDEPVLFISGAAPSGADDLIIRWCLKFNYPCLKMPADWDKFGKAAGFRRNEDMAKIATHALGFWDGQSPGSKHMSELSDEYKLHKKIILINAKENEQTTYQKSVLVSGCLI